MVFYQITLTNNKTQFLTKSPNEIPILFFFFFPLSYLFFLFDFICINLIKKKKQITPIESLEKHLLFDRYSHSTDPSFRKNMFFVLESFEFQRIS